jgi:putative nucleotidyltransferase with HDIG domain
MTTLQLDEVIRAVRDLPSLPIVVMELLEKMEHDDASSMDLSNKISQDQALAAKILRLANSSFYGMSSRVTTVPQAISILGFGTVRALVTAASLSGAFALDPQSPFNFSLFWKHAIATAICAKHLAPAHHIAPDIAFIAGLLHDIGQLVLATRFPHDYASVLEKCRNNDWSLVEAERAVFQTDHAAVGAALTQHWRFPALMQQAVASHHDADLDGTETLAAIVHVANALAHALDLTADPREAVPPIAVAAWLHIALDGESLARMLPRIEAEFAAISPILTV